MYVTGHSWSITKHEVSLTPEFAFLLLCTTDLYENWITNWKCWHQKALGPSSSKMATETNKQVDKILFNAHYISLV